MPFLSKELLEMLACPECNGGVKPDNKNRILCENCGLAFPIVEGIPIMLKEEAEKI